MSRYRVTAIAFAVLASLLVSDSPVNAAPASLRDPSHILVRFAASTSDSARQRSVSDAGGQLSGRLASINVDVVGVPAGAVDRVINALRASGRVEFAEPNYQMTTDAVPNDPFFPGNTSGSDLWGLKNTGQSSGTAGADIKASEGWDLAGIGGAGVWAASTLTVGIVDTGVDATHPDLAGKIAAACSSALSGNGTLSNGCVDGDGHGTHVAGTIAAVGDNGIGIVGVAPNAKVAPCKALNDSGSGYTSDIAACIDHLVSQRDSLNLRVISMSLGGSSSSTMQAAVDRAWNAGVITVAAAGNDGTSALSYPASYANTISVAATDRNDARASFSNYNSQVEIAAPGVAIVSTIPGGYGNWSGTSMATPHVAAVAALIYNKTGKTGQALRTALDAAVDDKGAAGRDNYFGFGRLNLCKAMGGCATSPTPTPTPAPTAAPTPTPTPVVSSSGSGTLTGYGYRSGRVRSSVVVAWTGPASSTARTSTSGLYRATLSSGTYSVSASYSRRACKAGSTTGPTTITATISSQATTSINWYC